MNKKGGIFSPLQGMIILLIVVVVSIALIVTFSQRSTPVLENQLLKARLSKCLNDGYSLIDEDFKTITEDSRLDPNVPFDIIISRCGLCLGVEGGETIVHLYDSDEDFIPDACEKDVGTQTSYLKWKSQCEEQQAGTFVKTINRCCLPGVDEKYCKVTESK